MARRLHLGPVDLAGHRLHGTGGVARSASRVGADLGPVDAAERFGHILGVGVELRILLGLGRRVVALASGVVLGFEHRGALLDGAHPPAGAPSQMEAVHAAHRTGARLAPCRRC